MWTYLDLKRQIVAALNLTQADESVLVDATGYDLVQAAIQSAHRVAQDRHDFKLSHGYVDVTYTPGAQSAPQWTLPFGETPASQAPAAGATVEATNTFAILEATGEWGFDPVSWGATHVEITETGHPLVGEWLLVAVDEDTAVIQAGPLPGDTWTIGGDLVEIGGVPVTTTTPVAGLTAGGFVFKRYGKTSCKRLDGVSKVVNGDEYPLEVLVKKNILDRKVRENQACEYYGWTTGNEWEALSLPEEFAMIFGDRVSYEPEPTSGTVTLRLNGAYRLTAPSQDDDTDWLMENGFEWLKYTAILELNMKVRSFVDRTEGALAPPYREQEKAWRALVAWDNALEVTPYQEVE